MSFHPAAKDHDEEQAADRRGQIGTMVGERSSYNALFDDRATLASAMPIVPIQRRRRLGLRSDVCYWIAVVALRAAATNLADFLTHDLGLSYLLTTGGEVSFADIEAIAPILRLYKVGDPARCRAYDRRERCLHWMS
jgi:hypothetical protein